MGINKLLMAGLLGASLDNTSGEVKENLDTLNDSSKNIKEKLGEIQERLAQRDLADDNIEQETRYGDGIIEEIESARDFLWTEFIDAFNQVEDRLNDKFNKISEDISELCEQHKQDIYEMKEQFDGLKQDNEKFVKKISDLIVENHVLVIRIAQKTGAVEN